MNDINNFDRDRIICFDYKEQSPIKEIVEKTKRFVDCVLYEYETGGDDYFYIFARNKEHAVEVLRYFDFGSHVSKKNLHKLLTKL